MKKENQMTMENVINYWRLMSGWAEIFCNTYLGCEIPDLDKEYECFVKKQGLSIEAMAKVLEQLKGQTKIIKVYLYLVMIKTHQMEVNDYNDTIVNILFSKEEILMETLKKCIK